MKVNYFNDKDQFPYLIIDNFYDDNELESIWEELDFLCYNQKLKPPESTGTAFDDKNFILKKNSALWLDSAYKDRNLSNILQVNRKIFNIWTDVVVKHPSWFFNNVDIIRDTTLISYYENQDHYKRHKDHGYLTSLTWFYKEPKRFNGGNLHFDEFNLTIEVKNNRTIMFPSTIWHSVDPVIMGTEFCGKKNGRFCMTHFMNTF